MESCKIFISGGWIEVDFLDNLAIFSPLGHRRHFAGDMDDVLNAKYIELNYPDWPNIGMQKSPSCQFMVGKINSPRMFRPVALTALYHLRT